MRSLDGPSMNTKRGSSVLEDEGENATVGMRGVQHKKAKFKTPLSTAHAANSENLVVSSCKLTTEISSNRAKKRVFGTDASNAQLPTDSRNNIQAAQKKSKRFGSDQSDSMPGFAGILEGVYNICPEAIVKIQSSDDVSDQEMNTAMQPKCQSPKEDNTATHKVKPSASTLEDNSRLEGDEAVVLRAEALRPRSNAVRSTAATQRSSIYSQFKMPARVRSDCAAQEVPETTPNVYGTLVRPQHFRTPYRSLTTPISNAKATESRSTIDEKSVSDYYCVMYCIRKPNAKHKGPWSDGVLIRQGRSSILLDTEGQVVSKDVEQRGGALAEGATLLMGKFEVEVMRICSKEEFSKGKVFQGTVDLPCDAVVKAVQRRPFKGFQAPPVMHSRVSIDTDKVTSRPKVKPALGKDTLLLNSKELQGGCSPIIVDPYLASKLRPHQREGVKFMYECVMGLRNSSFTGCLLADAMGLGKTLQVIALIWTLIKQGPGGNSAVTRVLVICPSSLVENWGKEVRKWLGDERLPTVILHSGTSAKDVKRKLSNFQVGKVYHLLITSYELLRKHKDDFSAAKPGLLVCDEAHRLKNCAGNKTIDSLLELKCSKRLLLTGTPIQNDLLEFYAMIDFVNPNLLGALSNFKRHYSNPIEKSRDRDASENEKNLGRARSAELQSMTRFCILQRAATVNAKYLPAKTEELQKIGFYLGQCLESVGDEANTANYTCNLIVLCDFIFCLYRYVVFCMLQSSQVSLYQKFLESKLVSESLASGQSAFVLSAIGTLRKLCNHPMLVDHEVSKGNDEMIGGSSKRGDGVKAFSGLPNRRYYCHSCCQSGQDVRRLEVIRKAGMPSKASVSCPSWLELSRQGQDGDCLQLYSDSRHHSVEYILQEKEICLALVEEEQQLCLILCEGQGWRWLRLDGTTNVSERQALVDRFNAGDSDHSVFLLSSKAGGSGLNLIGANRLVLFDPDWNPATDAQAMARVWRDGQEKAVFIYRLLSTASIEEKIYQRQIMKGEVAAAVEEQVEGHCLEGEGGGRRHFSREELRELFSLNLETSCDTFDLLSESESSTSDVWRDYSKEVDDHALKEAIQTGVVTFVHQKTNVKDTFSSLDNIQKGEDSKPEELETNQPHFSFVEIDKVPLTCKLKIADPQTDREGNCIMCLDHEHQPTKSTSVSLSKKDNVKEDWDAKMKILSSASSDVLVDEMVEKMPECNTQSTNAICREHKSIIGSECELLPKIGPSSVSFKILTTAERNCDADTLEAFSISDSIDDKLDDLGGGSLAAMSLSTVSKRDSYAQQNGNAKKHYAHNDEVDEMSEECDEHADHCDLKKKSTDLEDDHLVASNTNSKDTSPAPTHMAEEAFDCLLESRSQNFLNLMVNSPVLEDELDEDELEILDAPFLCSLDLEIEMKRASFAPEDLWDGFKLFAIGFILEEEEQRVAYRNSKLGLILDKCNVDKATDDESIYCKGFPMVQAILSKLDGNRAADLSHLFGKFEREEDLNATFSGRFTLALMRQLDRLQTKRDEQA